MATDAVILAAERLRENFKGAKEGGYYDAGWYSYMRKTDIEVLIEHAIGPEVKPRPVEVTISTSEGRVLWAGVVPDDGFKVENGSIVFPAELTGFGGAFGGHYDAEENVYTTGSGRRIANVHLPVECAGRPCVIHAPSEHHMRAWPTNFRTGGLFDIKGPHMERICPHGIGHPDPDDLAYWSSQGEDYSNHGCDGCCRSPKEAS